MDIKKLIKKLPGAWILPIIVVVWVVFLMARNLGLKRSTLFPIVMVITAILAVVWVIVILLTLNKAKKERDSKRMADATSAGSGRVKNIEEKLLFAIKSLRQ